MNLFYKYLLVLPTHIIINMNSKITTQEFKDYLISNHIPFTLTSKGEPDKRSSTVRKYYDKLYYEKYISQEVDKRLSVKQKIDNFVYNEDQEEVIDILIEFNGPFIKIPLLNISIISFATINDIVT